MSATLIELLQMDHKRIRELIGDLKSDCKKPSDRINEFGCLKTFRVLKALMVAHAKAEEYTLYSLFEDTKAQAFKELEHFSLEGYEEHDILDRLLKEMGQAEEVTERWRSQITVLSEILERHLHKEESDFFPKVLKLVEHEELLNLSVVYSRDRDEIFVKKGGLGVSSALEIEAEITKKRNQVMHH